MKVRHLVVDDLRWLKAQKDQSQLNAVLDEPSMKILEASRHSYTVTRDDGTIVLCGGLVEYWKGRAEAWVSFSQYAACDFIGVWRVLREFLNTCGVARVEAAVSFYNSQGHRLVRALGFKMEVSEARKFLPGGEDASIYSRVT
jgi:hypothetical protein